MRGSRARSHACAGTDEDSGARSRATKQAGGVGGLKDQAPARGVLTWDRRNYEKCSVRTVSRTSNGGRSRAWGFDLPDMISIAFQIAHPRARCQAP
jgi:hypothetical protein